MSDTPESTEGVDALVADLACNASGAPSRFSLARDKAKESLKEFLLADPFTYVLLLVRGAIRRGAATVEITINSRSLTLAFDGSPIPHSAFESLYDSVLDRQAKGKGLRELMLGLSSAVNLGFERVQLVSGDSGGAAELEMRPDAPDRISKSRASMAGTRIVIRGRLPQPQKSGSTRPELLLLRQRCQYASSTVRVNGETVANGLQLHGAIYTETFDGDGFRGVAGFLPPYKDGGQVRYVVDGVWVATTKIDADGFVAAVALPGAKLDASEFGLVMEERCEKAANEVTRVYGGYRTKHQWQDIQNQISEFKRAEAREMADGLARTHLRRRIALYVSCILAFCCLTALLIYLAKNSGDGVSGALSWDGKSDLTCTGDQTLTISNRTIISGSASIRASGNCQIRFTNTILMTSAHIAIALEEDASLEMNGGRLEGKTVIMAEDDAQVMLTGVALSGTELLLVKGRAEVHVVNSKLNGSQYGINASGTSRLVLTGVTVESERPVVLSNNARLVMAGGVVTGLGDDAVSLRNYSRAKLKRVRVSGKTAIDVIQQAKLDVQGGRLMGEAYGVNAKDYSTIRLKNVRVEGSVGVAASIEAELHMTGGEVVSNGDPVELACRSTVPNTARLENVRFSAKAKRGLTVGKHCRAIIVGGHIRGLRYAVKVGARAALLLVGTRTSGKLRQAEDGVLRQVAASVNVKAAWTEVLGFAGKLVRYANNGCKGVTACFNHEVVNNMTFNDKLIVHIGTDGRATKVVLPEWSAIAAGEKIGSCLKALGKQRIIPKFSGPTGRLICEFEGAATTDNVNVKRLRSYYVPGTSPAPAPQ